MQHQGTSLLLIGNLWALLLIAGCGEPPGLASDQLDGELHHEEDHANGGGEVWITGQASSRLFILHGRDHVETVLLPPGTSPHLIEFSPDGEFAYVSDDRNGDILVLRADDRQLIARLDFGTGEAHQARPTSDGSLLLVAQITTRTLHKVAADPAAGSWQTLASLVLPRAPVCTVFINGARRAYVSLFPSGVAVVDVQGMVLLKIIETFGFAACGLNVLRDGRTILVGGNEGGGHISFLDTATNSLVDGGYDIGAQDQHGFRLSPSQRIAYIASRGGDALKIVHLLGGLVRTVPLDPTPGSGNDQPDFIGVKGNNVYVTLRASGQLAIVKGVQGRVRFLPLAPPARVAIHGVTVRPG